MTTPRRPPADRQQLLKRILSPSALLLAGVFSLVLLVWLALRDGGDGTPPAPYVWFGLWFGGFVIALLVGTLIRLPSLLRAEEDER